MSRRCFVVMGFGVKTDLATGRKFNLDKSYEALIKPVVQSRGITCIRADEIRHSGAIDVPMYQELLTADVVIADLSTANLNTFYELGIRHALRPRTTIIISEQNLVYPFDVNHILINKYVHLGENIDYFEVLRFQKLLGETLDAVLTSTEPDSPIYTFLDGLVPPLLKKEAAGVHQQVNDALKQQQPPHVAHNADGDNPTLNMLVKQAEHAMEQRQYALAKNLFGSAILMMKTGADATSPQAPDPYLVHRCAYAAYKSKEPDELTALKEANSILAGLDLAHTNDAETVVLAGKIEKRLYFNEQGEQHLANAILYFERGYFLLNNRYNGINLAFLLNLRVASNLYTTREDKIADAVYANRIRRRVLELCRRDLEKMEASKAHIANGQMPADTLAATQQAFEARQLFWIMVNKAEAHFGLGEMEAYQEALLAARRVAHDESMMRAFTEQLETLRGLVRQQAGLFSPVLAAQ